MKHHEWWSTYTCVGLCCSTIGEIVGIWPLCFIGIVLCIAGLVFSIQNWRAITSANDHNPRG